MVKVLNIEIGKNESFFWCIGWLFTVGLAKLSFWQGVLALIIFPYYLGRYIGGIF